ncbi:MAG TPA: hypothetical protein VHN37_11530 [Actinomycetota bacterium]|nr:hypothetical protein [Actinomycetota bacterium]
MAPTAADLTLLGVGFRIVVDDERVAELVRLLWEPFAGTGEGEPVTVDIRRDGAGWRIASPPDPPSRADDPWILCVVLRNLLAGRAIAARPDLVPLHSSVVERDGFYLVLAGPSRAGKSTLAVELLLRGWRLVSDDLAPIAPTDATATRFLKPVQVRDPDQWRRVGGWEVPAWLPPPAVTALIPPAAFRQAPARPYRPDAVVFTRWDPGAEATMEPVTPARAAALCVTNVQGGRDASGDLPVLAKLCAGARTARMVYPSTPEAFALFGSFLHDSPPME